MIEQGMLKIKLIIFMLIIIFMFSGCVGVNDRGQIVILGPLGPVKFPSDNYKYLHWCFFNCEPDLCEVVGNEENILSTQIIDLAAIKANQSDRKSGDQLFLACLAKPKKSKILVERDTWSNTYLFTSNVYGHANGYQTDDLRIIKKQAKKNCQKLLKRLTAEAGYEGRRGLTCKSTCDMCRY